MAAQLASRAPKASREEHLYIVHSTVAQLIRRWWDGICGETSRMKPIRPSSKVGKMLRLNCHLQFQKTICNCHHYFHQLPPQWRYEPCPDTSAVKAGR